MKARDKYCVYWEERIGYNFKKEFDIYKYLCGNMKRKSQLRKIDDEMRFETYSAWERYVKSRFVGQNPDRLMEFSKFLNMHRRKEKTVDAISLNFFLPFYIAIMAGIFVPDIMKMDWAVLGKFAIEIVNIFMLAQRWVEKVFVILVMVVLVLLIMVFMIIIGFMIIGPLIPMFKDIFRSGLVFGFYDDYIKIVESTIKEMSCKEK